VSRPWFSPNYYCGCRSRFSRPPRPTHTVKAHLTNTTPTSRRREFVPLQLVEHPGPLDGSQAHQLATATYGPRIASCTTLRIGRKPDQRLHRILRDTTDNVKYDQPQDSRRRPTSTKTACSTAPMDLQRIFDSYPDGARFRHGSERAVHGGQVTLTNPSSTTSYNWNVLDQVHVNNTNLSDNVAGSYDTTRKAMFANMTASGQYVIFLGALQTASSYQVGNDSDLTSTDPTASAWSQFDATGSLHDNGSISTPNVTWFPELCHHCPNSSQTLTTTWVSSRQ